MLPLLAVVLACNNYGKKVKINQFLEVYLKGDSVTENDAKKLGNYIAGLSKDTNEKSFQLSKDSGAYEVRMVVDKEKLKADTTLDVSFLAFKSLLELEVFKQSKVKFIVTDNVFKDLKSY